MTEGCHSETPYFDGYKPSGIIRKKGKRMLPSFVRF